MTKKIGVAVLGIGAMGGIHVEAAKASPYVEKVLGFEPLDKQAEDGNRLTFMIYGTKGAIETDVFHRRIRRWEFTDGPANILSKMVETVNFTKEQDSEWFHNAAGHMQIVAELVAKGEKPFIRASDSFDSMRLGFAAELSEHQGRIIKFSEV